MKTYKLRRAGLTLLELVVVLVVLAALAALIIPRLNGVSAQAGSATSASVIGDMNRAVGLHEARYGKAANGWDGILTGPTGSLYPKLHPDLLNASGNVALPVLAPLTLTATQLKSLNAAGISFLHYNSEESTYTGRPSDSGVSFAFLAEGSQVCGLTVQGTSSGWTSHGSTFPDRALNLNPFNVGPDSGKDLSFVVFGVGQPCSLRGTTLQESPLLQAADPNQYYARMLCVYMIPGPSSTSSFTAQFVGSFAPDGTCLNDNLIKFNSSDVPL